MKKGLVIVHTGDGKGKTTAAFGLALRAVGHGMKVIVVQFIKSSHKTGEKKASKLLFPALQVIPMGYGFVNLKDRKSMEKAKLKAEKTLRFVRDCIAAGKPDVIILDELNNAVSYGLIPVEEVVDIINTKPRK
ncbi:MAG TPA: cob(I)yrinic acid a,c-diamide adenosyltransferase, partial [bacterium]|nr:cob(I)yrinic acid a,c-diamide adenosyltransferase [bacterium]